MNFTSNDLLNFTDNYLTHYWPITSSTMQQDLVGYADILSANQINYNSDRIGNQNESLDLSSGYAFLTAGYFFTTPEFSVSLWIYLAVIDQSSPTINTAVNLIDFSNGGTSDNIMLNVEAFNVSTFQMYFSTTCVISVQSSIGLENGQWNHLAATYDGATASIYVNGSLAGSVKQAYSLPFLQRSTNYFAHSSTNYGEQTLLLDDIRFYNISLTQRQISNIMEYSPAPVSSTSCKYSYLFLDH